MVEAAGVELFNLLIARNLLVLRMARRAEKAALPIALYVYCTKLLSMFSQTGPQVAAVATVPGDGSDLPCPDILGKFWNRSAADVLRANQQVT